MHFNSIPGFLLLFTAAVNAVAQQSTPVEHAEAPAELRSTYVLGAGDQISIRILQAQEIAEKPFRIEPGGFIELPLIGRVRASGLTIQQLQLELGERLMTYIRDPQVTVSIDEYRSQPVSILGAVTTPGVHQLQGRKTLTEVLSMAGGLRQDSGSSVKITRRLEWGRIPLPTAVDHPAGGFSVAEVNLKALMEAKNPEENVLVKPNDVISVPRAQMVYLIGEVEKSGGFVLNERETVSVLQSLSLAGGLRRTAAPQSAKILRLTTGAAKRTEIPVDLRRILGGKASDVDLQPDDILFVPGNNAKRAGLRAVEVAIQLGTGILIWRR